jgi:hydroxymethylpyrimidine/phosphomethylpyrimidine kinase
MLPICLTIASSDPSGGAGVSADLLTFNSLGCYGVFIISAITAQNLEKIYDIKPVDANLLAEQANSIFDSFNISAVKTGLIGSANHIDLIFKYLKNKNIPLIVDPVFKASVGGNLSSSEVINYLKEKLFPIATIVTPNLYEAEFLSNMKIKDVNDMIKASNEILKKQIPSVLIKGGHLNSKHQIIDVLNINGEVKIFEKKRLGNIDPHGSGCVLSASITSFLAHGFSIIESVMRAEEYFNDIFQFPIKFNNKYILKPNLLLLNDSKKLRIINELDSAFKILFKIKEKLKDLVDDESSIYYTTDTPLGLQDVASNKLDYLIENNAIHPCPVFGIKTICSQLILLINKKYSDIRAGIDLVFSRKLLDSIIETGIDNNYLEIDYKDIEELSEESFYHKLRPKGKINLIIIKKSIPERLIILGDNIFELITNLMRILILYKK